MLMIAIRPSFAHPLRPLQVSALVPVSVLVGPDTLSHIGKHSLWNRILMAFDMRKPLLNQTRDIFGI